jgi:hypothetical protein
MNRLLARIGAFATAAVLVFAPWVAQAQPINAPAARNLNGPPTLTDAEVGATVEDISFEIYGKLKLVTVQRYLTIQRGSRLDQAAVNQDYANLLRLGDYRYHPRLEIEPGSTSGTVRLHWIITSKWLLPTEHPFYATAPLSAAIQGVGFIVNGPPMDSHGSYFSAYTQLSKRANLGRFLYTDPFHVNPDTGTETSLVVDTFGGRGVFRISVPEAVNVYSWNAGQEALVLTQRTDGTQFEAGMRVAHSSNEMWSGLEAPSIFRTDLAHAHVTSAVAGLSHACTVPAVRWYPPFCDMQYRFIVTDAIGGLGATQTYRSYFGDVARYWAVGPSTFVVHANATRTGGVIPDSFVNCAVVRGYPKGFCGTDSEGWTAEYRINEEHFKNFEFVLFTEDAASRVRQSANANALPYFTWHPDSGVGVIFHLLRIDYAYGKAGGRLTFELRGQTF